MENIEIFIDVSMKRESRKNRKNLCHFVSLIVGENNSVAILDLTDEEDQQLDIIEALRDFADAIEAKING